MLHGEHHRLEAIVRQFVDDADAIFVQRVLAVGDGIVDHHIEEAAKLAHEIDDLGVARVGHVLLEGEAHDQDLGVVHLQLAVKHGLDDVAGDEARHAVIDAAPGEDHLRVKADRLRLVGQIIGIDADAVAADEARTIGVKIPFGAGGGKHLAGVEPEILEQHGKLVDQRDVHVALNVLDDLGGFRHSDRAHLVGAGGHHAAIDLVDEVGGLRRRARGDLDDGGEPVLQIAGIDALR